jgi:hypothetical protein
MEREQTLTTSDLAGSTAKDADAPLEREKHGTDRGATLTDGTPDQQDAPQADIGTDMAPPLFEGGEQDRFEARWQEIQTTFIDDPRQTVERADQLVAELMQQLASSFAEERARLEQQWDSGDNVSTEDLRVALTRYRSFFHRLLSA